MQHAAPQAATGPGPDRPQRQAACQTRKDNEMNTLTMLGTGSALVTRCYNTCFAISTPGATLLTDAGGGNGILCQLRKAGMHPDGIDFMFLTHAHTDHIMGAVWLVRTAASSLRGGRRHAPLRIFGHGRALGVLREMCLLLLSGSDRAVLDRAVSLCEVADGDVVTAGQTSLLCFDIGSTKEKQFGYRATLPGGTTLVCLGDEPFNERNRPQAEGADWLMSEAFCLYADRERYKPYEKQHSTALEAGRTAASLRARNLIVYHTEDDSLATRKERYGAEARTEYGGNVVVPDDLETIFL